MCSCIQHFYSRSLRTHTGDVLDFPQLTDSLFKINKMRRNLQAISQVAHWSLNGPVGNLTNSLQVSSHFVNLEQRISKLWEIEQCDEDSQSLSYDDRKVEDLWRREVKHEGGHYVVPIPWKDGRPSMPNNRAQAQGRLDNLIKRLQRGSIW